MNTILLADDHILFREGMRGIIAHWDEFEICGDARDGQEAIQMARELLPDIILMDIHMPVIDGIEATRRIAKELPSIRIVMLTISEEEDDLFRAIKYGAQGYILKDTPSKRLHDELRRLLQGEAPLSGIMAAKVLDEFNQTSEPAQPPCEYCEPLTEREQQVLELVAQGLNNNEIAGKLYLSENTVKKHLRNILDKLHLNNRVEAAVYAVRKGLVE